MLIIVSALGGILLSTALWSEAKNFREERRGWRACAKAPFFSYQEKNPNGAWVGIRFEVTWGHIGHGGSTPKSVTIPSEQEWREFPEWASSKRTVIIDRLKREWARDVEFVEAGSSTRS
jgi:hypothetical protein